MQIFMSYFGDEESDAEDIAEHLRSTFQREGLEIFMASSLTSIAPGDAWEDKLIEKLGDADILVVLMSVDALSRPWINFEIGVAWVKETRILFFCHKGMTPSALPRPYSSLQAVDLNGINHEEKLGAVVKAVSAVLGIREPTTVKEPHVPEAPEGRSFAMINRSWSLRPAAHLDETARGRFLVGPVNPARPDRAKATGLLPGEALFVRLFLGNNPEGRFINAMVGGEVATFFESVIRDTTFIDAEIRLAAAFEDGDSTIPLLLVTEFEEIGE